VIHYAFSFWKGLGKVWQQLELLLEDITKLFKLKMLLIERENLNFYT